MGVNVTFHCDGCDANAPGSDRLRKHFVSFSGRGYGFGTVQNANSVEDVTPDGWIAWDPCTYCTYCPSCAAEIFRDSDSTKDQQLTEVK